MFDAELGLVEQRVFHLLLSQRPLHVRELVSPQLQGCAVIWVEHLGICPFPCSHMSSLLYFWPVKWFSLYLWSSEIWQWGAAVWGVTGEVKIIFTQDLCVGCFLVNIFCQVVFSFLNGSRSLLKGVSFSASARFLVVTACMCHEVWVVVLVFFRIVCRKL